MWLGRVGKRIYENLVHWRRLENTAFTHTRREPWDNGRLEQGGNKAGKGLWAVPWGKACAPLGKSLRPPTHPAFPSPTKGHAETFQAFPEIGRKTYG